MTDSEKLRRKRLSRSMRHPNQCFCAADGQTVLYGEYLRTEIWVGVSPYNEKAESEINIYMCNRCGNECNDAPAFA